MDDKKIIELFSQINIDKNIRLDEIKLKFKKAKRPNPEDIVYLENTEENFELIKEQFGNPIVNMKGYFIKFNKDTKIWGITGKNAIENEMLDDSEIITFVELLIELKNNYE